MHGADMVDRQQMKGALKGRITGMLEVHTSVETGAGAEDGLFHELLNIALLI